MMNSYSKTERNKKIFFIYHYYLFNWNDKEVIDNLLNSSNYNFKQETENDLMELFKNIQTIEKNIIEKIKVKWSWDRMYNLDKEILIYGYWLLNTIDIDKAIIIDEMINFAKKYGSSEKTYKFVNAILDNF